MLSRQGSRIRRIERNAMGHMLTYKGSFQHTHARMFGVPIAERGSCIALLISIALSLQGT